MISFENITSNFLALCGNYFIEDQILILFWDGITNNSKSTDNTQVKPNVLNGLSLFPVTNSWSRRGSVLLTFRLLEVNGDERTEVSIYVLEWEEVARESTMRIVLNRADVLDVSWIFALAVHPHRVDLEENNLLSALFSQGFGWNRKELIGWNGIRFRE